MGDDALFQEDLLIANFGSRDAAVAVLQVYLEEERAVVEPLRIAIEEGFTLQDGLEGHAHRVKGSLDLIGASRLSSLATQIGESCRSGEHEEAKQSLVSLWEGLLDLKKEIEQYITAAGN